MVTAGELLDQRDRITGSNRFFGAWTALCREGNPGMRIGLSRWLAGILAVAAVVVFWLWLSYHRAVDYSAWQMTALVQAFAAYAAMEGGELPGSLEDLRKSPLVVIDGNTLRVKRDHIPALRTTQTYPDMIRIDFRDLRVRWLHQSSAQTGPIVESRRFQKALMPLAERLTRALDEFRAPLLLPETGRTRSLENKEPALGIGNAVKGS